MSPPCPGDRPALRVVRADNPSTMTLDGTRSFVIGVRRPVVIDPGPDDAGHLRAIERALGGETPVAILLTHAHPDHAAGAPALSARIGAPIRAATGAGVLPIADGESVETDVGEIRAWATPGHAPDHLAFSWTGGGAPGGGALFVGDLLMGRGDTTLVAPPGGEIAAYLRSLDRVVELAPAILYPAHGPPLSDPADAVRRYRRHRLARIERVREASRSQPGASPRQLVDSVYGRDFPPALRDAAEGSIRSILEFLATRSGN